MPSALRADDKDEPASLSDAIGDGLSKLQPLINEKKWDEALQLVQGLMQNAKPDSYDQAVLNQTEAQLLVQKGDYPPAIAPLEASLQIADRHHYYSNRDEANMEYFLSQLYYQKADTIKGDKEAQLAAYKKSIDYIQRWFTITAKPTEDISMYYAQVLYAAAVARDPAHPDMDFIHQARVQIERTLMMSVHPKDTTYMFLLATLEQQKDYAQAAETLELLLSHNPSSKTYWQDLNGFYMTLAQDAHSKDPRTIRRYNIRAINTIERAQKLGFLKAPRDNFTLFTLYYNIGEYGLAADLLYADLKAGTIESTMDNWLLLAASFQQINQDFKEIDVLNEAAQRFPQNGELEYKIAQAYLQLDKNQEAYEHAKAAFVKGHVSKPQSTYVFLAYIAFEVGQYDDAKAAIDKALELNGKNKPDHQAIGLRNAIDEAIKERDAKKTPPAPEKA